MSGFKKAVRDYIWAKVLLVAPSGAGKSYSALRVTKGMIQAHEEKTGEKASVAFIGTESSRDKYYANEFDYDLLQLSAPFTPESYIEAIQMAIDGGYKFLIIDSTTHEWAGTGGVLDIHSKIPGNSYTAWARVTPRHNNFLDAMIETPIHVIATVRGKDEYVMEEVNGKQVPKKVAMGYSQRDGYEYLFTTSFMIEQDTHIASAMKDNTHIFENANAVLTEKHGVAIYEWATGGDVAEKQAELDKSKEEGKRIMQESIEKEKETQSSQKVESAPDDEKVEIPKKTAKELISEITTESTRLTKNGMAPKAFLEVFANAGFKVPKDDVPVEKLQAALDVLKGM